MPSPLLPSVPAPSAYHFENVRRRLQSVAASGKVLTRQIGGQRFDLTLEYPAMTEANAAALIGFLTARGDDPFYVEIPNLAGAAGEVAGQYVMFTDDTKLHIIESISPTVVYPTARVGGVGLTTSPVYFYGKVARPVQKVKYGSKGYVKLEIDLKEEL